MHSEKTNVAVAATAPAEEIAIEPGTRRLFLDDQTLAEMRGVRRTLHCAEKDPNNPLLVADRPWEGSEVFVYGSVLREGGLWRMWYLTHHHPEGVAPVNRNAAHTVCYAESDDGIRWRKPALDLVPFRGEKSNILFGANLTPTFREFHGVIRDDRDPDPAQRYKAIVHGIDFSREACAPTEGRRYFTACSPDGLRWSRVREIPTHAPINPDIGQFTYDPVEGRYLLWARARYAPDAVRARAPREWFGRAVALFTSRDFVHWEDHGIVMAADLEDPPGADIYSFAGFPCGDLWLGLVQAYYQGDQHTLDIQLACSRDGFHWTRIMDRRPLLTLGGIGEWDRFNMSTVNELVEDGDDLYLYYAGRTYRHGGSQGYSGEDSGPDWTAIGRARLRRDGFVSLDASFDGGEIVTRPLRIRGGSLFLNAKANHGVIRVEALDAAGVVRAAARPISEDGCRLPVVWTSPAGPALFRAPLKLRIRLSNAQLFALGCE